MQILVHSNDSIQSDASLNNWASTQVADGLERFRSHLTRVEVFLSDTNKDKHGARDKRCSIEAKYEGLQSLAASNDGETLYEALRGATDKLAKVLDKKISKLSHRKGNIPIGGPTFATLNRAAGGIRDESGTAEIDDDADLDTGSDSNEVRMDLPEEE